MIIFWNMLVLILWIGIGIERICGEPWGEWFIWLMYGICVVNAFCELLKKIAK